MSKKYSIAMTSNVFPFGPGLSYGGERICGYLASALANRGHKVYLFAPKGTISSDNLKDFTPITFTEDQSVDDYAEAVFYYEFKNDMKFEVYQGNYFGNKFYPRLRDNYLWAELVWNCWCHAKPFFQDLEPRNILSYSYLLQEDLQNRGVGSTMIHYGIPKDLYEFSPDTEDYCVWIAKIEGGKRPDLAIKLAKAAGVKIVIMGPPYNTGCFWNMVAPYIDNQSVFWVRGVDDEQKKKIMSKAKFFISSNGNDWREHFGITNIESLACGTPIIAFNKIGQECAIWTDQIIKDGESGFFLNYNNADDEEEIISKGLPLINKIADLSRLDCRKQFVDNFTSDIMAERYEYFYDYVYMNGPVSALNIPF